jgi:hypothetical protein
MRIELSLPSWADVAQRADDDAHTLTVAASSTPEWVQWQWAADAAPTQRAQVAPDAPVVLTLTFRA